MMTQATLFRTVAEELAAAYPDNADVAEQIDTLNEMASNKDASNEKAREKRSQNKPEDTLIAPVTAAVSSMWKTIEQLTADVQVTNPEATKGKVQHRVSALVKSGAAVKYQKVTVADNKSHTTTYYAVAGTPEPTAE